MSFFTILEVGMLKTNCYIFADRNICIVIDPGAADKRIFEKIKSLSPNPEVSILLTHGHADHFMGVDFLLRQFPGTNVYISEDDKPYLSDSNKNCAKLFGLDIILNDQRTLKIIHDKDSLHFGKYTIDVISTPGHTPGGVIYVLRDLKTIFSGDTLFQNGRGRTDFVGGNAKTLNDSIVNKIFPLPKDFKVYPGHGSSTTVGEEARYQQHYY